MNRTMYDLAIMLYFVLCGLMSSCSSLYRNSQSEIDDTLWSSSNYSNQGHRFLERRMFRSDMDAAYRYPKYPNHYFSSEYPTYPYDATYPSQSHPHSVQSDKYYHDSSFQQAVDPHHPAGPFYPYPNELPTFISPSKSVMDVLHSVARNDDRQCILKIICEITSDSISGRQSTLNLPVAINMQSLLGSFSALKNLQTSPLFYFAKAALLGYTQKGESRTCGSHYPNCPADPDKLIQYLNNHNGGFFRFFGGLAHGRNQKDYTPFYQGHQVHQNTLRHQPFAEERIQNRPPGFMDATNVEQGHAIAFSTVDFQDSRSPEQLSLPPTINHFFQYKTKDPFKFPEVNENNLNQPFRKSKELQNDLSSYEYNSLDLQKPLPNHIADPMIFPDRTGTGELRLDLKDFDNSYRNPNSFAIDAGIRSQRFNGNDKDIFHFPK